MLVVTVRHKRMNGCGVANTLEVSRVSSLSTSVSILQTVALSIDNVIITPFSPPREYTQ